MILLKGFRKNLKSLYFSFVGNVLDSDSNGVKVTRVGDVLKTAGKVFDVLIGRTDGKAVIVPSSAARCWWSMGNYFTESSSTLW